MRKTKIVVGVIITVILVIFGLLVWNKKLLLDFLNGSCKYEGTEAVCNQLIVQFPYGLPDEKIKEVEAIINANGGKIIERYSPEIPGFTIEIKPEEKLMNLKKILEQSESVTNVGYNMILSVN